MSRTIKEQLHGFGQATETALPQSLCVSFIPLEEMMP